MIVPAAPYPYVEAIITIGTWSIVEFVCLDTGYDGGLIVPAKLVYEVSAEPDRGPFAMADGAVIRAPFWAGTVEIDDHIFNNIGIAAMGPRFLIGREVLDQMTVCFVRGREVRLEF